MSDLDNSNSDSGAEPFVHDERDKVHGRVVAWNKLSFTIPPPRSRIPCKRGEPAQGKVLLSPMSGEVPAAQCLAVMGSSGAGKTTFLSALANQLKGGNLEGSITVDGQPLTKALFRQLCGFVKQDDVLLPNLSVRETIEFYADLRLPRSMSRKEKKHRVDATIAKLGLTHCQHTKIGDANQRGISGGEKRRVSIAVELIRNPTIIFLDEPTSGLDSCTALSVVNTLADLAHNYNHTVICTIHQPRSTAFAQFDRVMLLAKGHQIYCGPTPKAEAFFQQMGYECPEYENPADFYIDMLTLDSTSLGNEEESKRRVNEIITFAESNNTYEPEEIKDELDKDKSVPGGAWPHMQVYLITKRSFQNTFRNINFLIGRFAQAIVMAVGIAILWWQIDNDQSAIQDRTAVVFMLLLGAAFPEAMGAILVFPKEREVFRRERRAGMYRLGSYYIAKQVAEFPLQVLAPSAFVIVVYFAVGLPDDVWIFGTFLSIIILMALTISSLGMLFGALLPAQAAAVLVPCYMIVTLMLAGFYVNPENLPTWIGWARYTSVFYYAFQAVILNQYKDLKFRCESDQFESITATGTCTDGTVLSSTDTYCPVTRGQQVIDLNESDDFTIWQYQLILLAFVIGYRLMIYPALKWARPREIGA